MYFFAGLSFLPLPVFHKWAPFFLPAVFVLGAFIAREYQHYGSVFNPFYNSQGVKSRSLTWGRWPVAVFVVCMGVGLISALERGMSWQIYFIMALACVSAFYIGRTCGVTHIGFGNVAAIVCICMATVAAIGIAELISGRNPIYENLVDNSFYIRYSKYSSRPMSSLYNPSALGSYFTACLPFCFYFINSSMPIKKALGTALFCAGIALAILTASRGVFLGLLAMLIFYLFVRKRYSAIIMLSVAVVVFIAVASKVHYPPLRQFDFRRLVVGSQDSILSHYRIERIAMTGRILRAHPLTGIGWGHFRLRFYEYSSMPDGELTPYEVMIPDNMYLSILSESGLIGFAGFVIFCIYIFSIALKKYKEYPDSARMSILIPMAGLVGLLVNMAAYDIFYWDNIFALFCFLAGLSVSGTDSRIV